MAAEIPDFFSLGSTLKTGLVPVVVSMADRAKALETYVSLYISQEVRQEGIVRNLSAFARFLEAAAFSHGSIFNMSEVARECETSRTAVEGYFSILEDLLVACRLPVSLAARNGGSSIMRSFISLMRASTGRSGPRGLWTGQARLTGLSSKVSSSSI